MLMVGKGLIVITYVDGGKGHLGVTYGNGS